MKVEDFNRVVKSFCHENNLGVNVRSADGKMIATNCNMYRVAVVFTLSEWGEVHMEIKGLTTFLAIQVNSGRLQVAHPRWKTYAQKIGQMVEEYDRNN